MSAESCITVDDTSMAERAGVSLGKRGPGAKLPKACGSRPQRRWDLGRLRREGGLLEQLPPPMGVRGDKRQETRDERDTRADLLDLVVGTSLWLVWSGFISWPSKPREAGTTAPAGQSQRSTGPGCSCQRRSAISSSI